MDDTPRKLKVQKWLESNRRYWSVTTVPDDKTQRLLVEQLRAPAKKTQSTEDKHVRRDPSPCSVVLRDTTEEESVNDPGCTEAWSSRLGTGAHVVTKSPSLASSDVPRSPSPPQAKTPVSPSSPNRRQRKIVESGIRISHPPIYPLPVDEDVSSSCGDADKGLTAGGKKGVLKRADTVEGTGGVGVQENKGSRKSKTETPASRWTTVGTNNVPTRDGRSDGQEKKPSVLWLPPIKVLQSFSRTSPITGSVTPSITPSRLTLRPSSSSSATKAAKSTTPTTHPVLRPSSSSSATKAAKSTTPTMEGTMVAVSDYTSQRSKGVGTVSSGYRGLSKRITGASTSVRCSSKRNTEPSAKVSSTATNTGSASITVMSTTALPDVESSDSKSRRISATSKGATDVFKRKTSDEKSKRRRRKPRVPPTKKKSQPTKDATATIKPRLTSTHMTTTPLKNAKHKYVAPKPPKAAKAKAIKPATASKPPPPQKPKVAYPPIRHRASYTYRFDAPAIPQNSTFAHHYGFLVYAVPHEVDAVFAPFAAGPVTSPWCAAPPPEVGNTDPRLRGIEMSLKCQIRLHHLPMKSCFYRSLPRRLIVVSAKSFAIIHSCLIAMEEVLPRVMEHAVFYKPFPVKSQLFSSEKGPFITREVRHAYQFLRRHTTNMKGEDILPWRIIPSSRLWDERIEQENRNNILVERDGNTNNVVTGYEKSKLVQPYYSSKEKELTTVRGDRTVPHSDAQGEWDGVWRNEAIMFLKNDRVKDALRERGLLSE